MSKYHAVLRSRTGANIGKTVPYFNLTFNKIEAVLDPPIKIEAIRGSDKTELWIYLDGLAIWCAKNFTVKQADEVTLQSFQLVMSTYF